MRENNWHRIGFATACALTLLPIHLAPAHAQDRASPADNADQDNPPDGFNLRTLDDQADENELQQRFREPLAPSRGDQSGDLNRDLRSDTPPPLPPEPDQPTVDIFAGPSAPALSRRENLVQERRDAGLAAPVGRQQGAAQEPGPDETGSPTTGAPTDLFNSVGPVRPPTAERIGRAGALDTRFGTLRPALPLSGDDPFAAPGIRAGRSVLYPTLEQSVGASTNLTNSVDGVSGAFSQTTLGLRARSDWSRHEAELNAAATYRRNFAGPVEEEPAVNLDGRLRLDLSRDYSATLRGALSYSRDDPIVTGLPQTAEDQADVLTYSASAELSRDVGRTHLSGTVEAVREDRSASTPFDTGFMPSDSFTTYTSGLRGGYDLSPALRPFLSASLGRRVFDESLAGGTERDSLIPSLRAGVGIDFGEKLSGEIALGYAWNKPDADLLRETASPTVDARIDWSPRRGTDVRLEAATYFEPDASGSDTSTLYQTTLGVRHRARARLDLEGRLVAGLRRSETSPSERLYAGEAGFSYWLSRYLALTGLYRYDLFDGATEGGDYDAHTIRVGVRVQR